MQYATSTGFKELLNKLKGFIETNKRLPTEEDGDFELVSLCGEIDSGCQNCDTIEKIHVEQFPYFVYGKLLNEELPAMFGRNNGKEEDLGFFIPDKLLRHFAMNIVNGVCMADCYEYTLLSTNSPYRQKMFIMLATIKVEQYMGDYRMSVDGEANAFGKTSPKAVIDLTAHLMERYGSDTAVYIVRMSSLRFMSYLRVEQSNVNFPFKLSDSCFECHGRLTKAFAAKPGCGEKEKGED